MTQSAKKKGNEFLKAIGDLFIICLLLAAAGFGGYFYGIHQRLGPIQLVPPGTPGAQPAVAATSETTSKASTEQKSAAPNKLKRKYWVVSSGVDYIGSSVAVKVNDEQVDLFFGPGKTIDVSRLVKKGDNTITFESKTLGDGYNKHEGDATSLLTLNLVSGPSIREDYKKSDVLKTFNRSAVEADDDTQTEHFSGE